MSPKQKSNSPNVRYPGERNSKYSLLRPLQIQGMYSNKILGLDDQLSDRPLGQQAQPNLQKPGIVSYQNLSTYIHYIIQ